jgi:hypothetical protein
MIEAEVSLSPIDADEMTGFLHDAYPKHKAQA